jgi:hypothetical protein
VAYLFLVRRMRILFPLVAIASLSACSFYESREYRIAGSAHRDAAKVRRIVQQVATQAGLPDRTHATHIDHHYPIAAFMDPHTSIEAYPRERDIEVSLSRSDWPPPVAFRRADRLLAPALSETFGRRFSVLPKSDAERIIVVH